MSTDRVPSCDVWELSRRRGTVQGELAVSNAPRLAAALADAEGTLRYRLTGRVDELGRPAATLDMHGTVRARCDRCGGAVDLPIDEQAQFFFVADERQLDELPIDESAEEPLLGSRRFDLAALLEDQAILALPISPRHDRCAGPAEVDDKLAGETRRPFDALAALKKSRR